MPLAIIGDFNPNAETHVATNAAISHTEASTGISIEADWIATTTILTDFERIANQYSGFWIAPGSPYQSMEGVLSIIRFARLNKKPVLGTCGGFQNMVIEFARNVLNIEYAAHAEYDPYASKLVINPLSCSLVGQTMDIRIKKNTLTHRIFKTDLMSANYYCNFGLNPEYRRGLDDAGFKVTGTDDDDEVRILEVEDHPFFIATLFVPQVNSSFERPNPLITEFLKTVAQAKTIEK